MKLLTLFGAGALVAATIAAPAAEAQRYGGYGHGARHGWHGGSYGGWHGGYGYRPYRHGGWGDGYRYRGPRGCYGRPYGYRGGRFDCRVHRGPYGPARRCTRFY